ncbi:hypothetical protein J4212_00705 [Candidatus Woesearchaeota archaeon]|nr:hypothetical protein [Candidatus Woesearchaeota archaeon]
MKGKRAAFLILLLVFLINLIPASVFAQESGIRDSMRRVSNLWWGAVEGIFTPEILQTEAGKMAFLRFAFFFLVFTMVHFGTSKIPGMNPRHGVVISLIFALFTLLIKPSTVIGLGMVWTAVVVLMLSLGLVIAVMYTSWSLPDDSMGNVIRIILLFVALGFLLYLRGVVADFVLGGGFIG